MKVSVIITTCNRADMFLDTLRSVLAQTYPADDFEIIILDNASTDDTPEVAKSFIAGYSGRHTIRYLREDRVGLIYARGKAAHAMRGEIYAQIEDDAIADPNWLHELVAPLDGVTVGMTGGKVLPRWEVRPPSWILPFAPYLTILDHGDEDNMPYITGCSLAIPRRILFEVGGFNPDCFGSLWLGDGEVGLQHKVRRAGYKVRYVARSVVWHWIPRARLTVDYMRLRLSNEASCTAQSVFQESHPGRPELCLWAIHNALRAINHMSLALNREPLAQRNPLFT